MAQILPSAVTLAVTCCSSRWETGPGPFPQVSWTPSLHEPSKMAELVLGNFHTQASRDWRPSLLEGWLWGPGLPRKKSTCPKAAVLESMHTGAPARGPGGAQPFCTPPEAPDLGPLTQLFPSFGGYQEDQE